MAIFRNRSEAGRQLAFLLENFHLGPQTHVLALPRGGAPVGFEVARHLEAPFDVFLVRKLGVPGQEELAMGALASGGVRFLNEEVLRRCAVSEKALAEVTEKETRELARRDRLYRGDAPPLSLAGKTAVLVDDGLATGSTMRAAVRAVRLLHPTRVVVAVPVAAHDTCAALRTEADVVVCAHTPAPFRAVGLWYDDFDQTTDEEVCALLRKGANR